MITLELMKVCGEAFRFASPLLYIEKEGKRIYYILAEKRRMFKIEDAAQQVVVDFLPASHVEAEVIGYLQGKGYCVEVCPVA